MTTPTMPKLSYNFQTSMAKWQLHSQLENIAKRELSMNSEEIEAYKDAQNWTLSHKKSNFFPLHPHSFNSTLLRN